MNDASKISHIDIVKNPDIVEFLNNCTFMRNPTGEEINEIVNSFISANIFSQNNLPKNIITIDSSSYEASVRDDIPYTNIGYVKLVNTLLKHNDFLALQNQKFINPFHISELIDKKELISIVLPSSNIKYGDCETTIESFRKALDDSFERIREENNIRNTSLKETLFWLASYRNNKKRDEIVLHKCPNSSCGKEDIVVLNIEEPQFCPHCGKRIFATDILRLYEELDETAPKNQAVLSRFEKVIRHIYLAHMLRIIKEKNKNIYLNILNDIAFIVNGPLAIMGTAAWIHGSMMKIIYEINVELRKKGYKDLLIIGLIKEGQAIHSYAQMINKHLPRNTFFCVTDEFRDKYITFNRQASSTTFGAETYYGQDFIWKTPDGNIVIFDIPYHLMDKTNKNSFKVEKSKFENYNNLENVFSLLKEMRSDSDSSSITPLVVSRQYTAISLEPGSKVLELLSKNNIVNKG